MRTTTLRHMRQYIPSPIADKKDEMLLLLYEIINEYGGNGNYTLAEGDHGEIVIFTGLGVGATRQNMYVLEEEDR